MSEPDPDKQQLCNLVPIHSERAHRYELAAFSRPTMSEYIIWLGSNVLTLSFALVAVDHCVVSEFGVVELALLESQIAHLCAPLLSLPSCRALFSVSLSWLSACTTQLGYLTEGARGEGRRSPWWTRR